MIELAHKEAEVLVVDDDYMGRKLLIVHLNKGFGLQVVACADPEEAISELHRNQPFVAAMFTDYHLSPYTGDHLALQARGINPGLPICIVSADDFLPKQLKYFEYQNYYLLRKPIGKERLGLVLSMIQRREHRPFSTYYP